MADEAGQALIEFAIVVSVLLMIVTGIIYFGRYLDYDLSLNHMASVGARYAAVNSGPTGSGAALESYITQNMAPSGMPHITVYIYPNGTGTGTSAQVNQPITVCIVMNSLGGLPFTKLIPGKLVRSATMRSETSWTTPDSESTASAAGCPA